MPELTTPRDLFLHELGDILYVEQKLAGEVLPKLIQEVMIRISAGVSSGTWTRLAAISPTSSRSSTRWASGPSRRSASASRG